MSRITNTFFQQSLPENFSDCRMKKKGLVKTVQVNHFSVSPKCFHWKSLKILAITIKYDYLLSIGFPGPVWQDWSLYIRPPIKDPVQKSCPGRVDLQSLPYNMLYIALWASANCTENLKCGAAPCLFIVDVMCMREPSSQRTLWTVGGWLSALILGTAGILSLGWRPIWSAPR